jgi:hypothetical protein
LLTAFGPLYHKRSNGSTSETKIDAAFIFARADFVNVDRYERATFR